MWSYISAIWPALFIILAAANDIITILPLPGLFQKIWRVVSSPFRNFMKNEDLLDPTGPPLRLANLRVRSMLAISVIAFAEWVGVAVFGTFGEDASYNLRPWLLALGWVRLSTHDALLLGSYRFTVLHYCQTGPQASYHSSISHDVFCDGSDYADTLDNKYRHPNKSFDRSRPDFSRSSGNVYMDCRHAPYESKCPLHKHFTPIWGKSHRPRITMFLNWISIDSFVKAHLSWGYCHFLELEYLYIRTARLNSC